MKKDKVEMTDWWIWTVGLTFFPTLATILIDLLKNLNVDFKNILGSGELILCAFLVTAPSIPDFYNKHSTSPAHKWAFAGLLLTESLQLITYTIIKVTPNYNFYVAVIASAVWVLVSLILGWRGTVSLKMEDQKDD